MWTFLIQITIFENENNMKLREYEVKLQSTEDVNRHSMTELRKLLSNQQRMCARYLSHYFNLTDLVDGGLTSKPTSFSYVRI